MWECWHWWDVVGWGRVRLQNTPELSDTAVVMAARNGDQEALEQLLKAYLPLVYNIVGRALNGHADVDDVVQETMVRAVNGLAGLREPDRFRAWLVSITVRQLRDRWRGQRLRPQEDELEEASETVDPEADFADLTILRLALSGQRREAAEATRWMDNEERDVLSLWWLEASGELTRAELAEACGMTPQHAAVRVQRVKARLETSRAVVRALAASPRCQDLFAETSAWDGRPSPLWRKRLARHVSECPKCALNTAGLMPAEGLLGGLALVPVSAGLTGWLLVKLVASTTAGTAATSGATAAVGNSAGRLSHLVAQLAAKPVAMVTAGAVATAVTGGTAVYLYAGPHHSPARPIVAAPTASAWRTPSAGPSVGGMLGSAVSTPAPAVYGSVVDGIDAAPGVFTRPAALPVRPEGQPVGITGTYAQLHGGQYVMQFAGNYLTLTGQGYFRVRWQLVTRYGRLQMPTWTGLHGKLFHVASGGGRRMDDQVPGATDLPHTWMGSRSTGFDTLPSGTQQMWQNEFFYLDGSVTLHLNQGWAEDNLIVADATRASIVADVDTAPDQATGIVRYGLVRDTGTDSAPVPQYLTRATPADPLTVPQHSRVS